MLNFIGELLKGLGKNVGITFFAALLPLAAGVLLALLVKHKPVFSKIASWLNIPCAAISIPAAVLAIYFVPGYFVGSFDGQLPLRELAVVLVLMLAFFWYIPAHYKQEYSYAKNVLYNGLGLISGVFGWSLVGGFVGIHDIVRAAQNYAASSFAVWQYIVVVLVTGVILGVLELGRVMVKQFMK